MEDHCIILFRLEGVLQSWGEHSRFDYRDSAPMPSKSGIVGMIGCAMGLKRGSEHLFEISERIRMAVRCDRPGKTHIDYHTVTADRAILNAKGEAKKDSVGKVCKTIASYRTYLQDAFYLAAIETDRELAKEIDQAFQNPCWPIYLGRKSCVPSSPVYIGIREYASLEEAMNRYPLAKGRTEREQKHMESSKIKERIYYEIESVDGRGYERTDELMDASERSFVSRHVILVRKEVVN